jgi:Cof subfamily protein (haloacid dehalogenase superfamily)
MIKLIVADMDGTLLDENKKLSPDFWEVEQKLYKKGILFAVASGRQFYNLEEVFEKIKHRILFLAENGTYAFYKGNEIFVKPLDKKSAVEFIKIGRAIKNAFLIVCGKNAAYIENTDQQFVVQLKKHYKKVAVVPDLTKVEDTILKITLCDFGNAEQNSYGYFKKFEKDFKVAVSGKIWLDITDFSANKATAILEIQQQLGISYDETMVFGDFLNDLEMMKTGKYSYAMKNAHAEILKVSNFVTEFDNNNGGVTKTIKALVF